MIKELGMVGGLAYSNFELAIDEGSCTGCGDCEERCAMEALSLAGGMSEFANEEGIRILRRNKDGSQEALSFDYSAVAGGSELETNILLNSGDVVVVPEGF